MKEAIKKELYQEYALAELSNEDLYNLITQVFAKQATGHYYTVEERIRVVDEIYSSIRGYGVLDNLLLDESITEIMVNRFDEVYIERNGHVERSDCEFKSEEELDNCIQRIVSLAGREVNQANPIVDTRLPGGERVNVVLPPISLSGPLVTIRRFPKEPITMERLIEWGSITEEAALFLEELVHARYNIFISGGTSSGKTTFLNALSNYIPSEERIITIEDSAELQIHGIPNLVRMETRNANTSGAGRVTMQELIKTSLRMRPERIIVGEVRGAEALDMLNAMNTGHDGSLSTGHANSSYDMLSRLESMVLQGGANLPLAAVRRNIASSIDVIVHLSRAGASRRVVEICEMEGLVEGEYQLRTLYHLEKGHLVPTGEFLRQTYKLEAYGSPKKGEQHEKREKAEPARIQARIKAKGAEEPKEKSWDRLMEAPAEEEHLLW